MVAGGHYYTNALLLVRRIKMKIDYVALLAGIMKSRRMKPYSAAPVIGVSVSALQSFIAGLPVSDRHEAKIIKWVEAKI
jgi:hypothetical protein